MRYTYKRTAIISSLLTRLEILKGILEALPTQPLKEERLRRTSLLKSSLFSARIEGNPLHLSDLSSRSIDTTKDQKRKEVANILIALNWIRSARSPKNLSLAAIQKLHKTVMDDLSSEAGAFRHEPSAIFNATGIAIYMPPPPSAIAPQLKTLIQEINSSTNPRPVTAALAHFTFEKIHPFLDGNGRVGRLISTFILTKSGYDFRGLLPWEEILEKKRQDYYDLLTLATRDINPFVEFFLTILIAQAENIIEVVKTVGKDQPEDMLLPRRREILLLIRDHQMVSFDFIRRRFLRVSESTLHYDIKQLLKAGLIRKLGSTRGVVYMPNDLL